MNMPLIVMEGDYVAIDDDYSTCHGYYIILFSSSPYIIQEYLIIYVQVISSCEMVREGNYFSQSISILIIRFVKKYIQ